MCLCFVRYWGVLTDMWQGYAKEVMIILSESEKDDQKVGGGEAFPFFWNTLLITFGFIWLTYSVI